MDSLRNQSTNNATYAEQLCLQVSDKGPGGPQQPVVHQPSRPRQHFDQGHDDDHGYHTGRTDFQLRV